MRYVHHLSSPLLSRYIDYICYLDNPMPYRYEKIFPLPALDLKINLGGAWTAYPNNKSAYLAVDSWCVGLWNEYHLVEWPKDMQVFIVYFKPYGLYPFLRVPLSELHNQFVSLDAIWGQSASEVRERLLAAPSIEAGLATLEQLLLERLCEVPYGFPMVQYALKQIARQHGALSIRALSDEIGVSQKHLITQFKQMIGGSPKELARLYRFQHVLECIDPAQSVDWTLLAHQANYYDQSHFNKDFETFTGSSPTEYLLARRRVYAEYPAHAQYIRQMPTG